MPQKLAQVLSYLLHPALFPILGVLFILKTAPFTYSPKVVIITILMVFIGTYLIPLLLTFLLLRLRLIHNLHLRQAHERKIPYLITALSFMLTASSIFKLQLLPQVHLFLWGSAMVIMVHLTLLFFTKPSAHLAGIGGFTGLVIALSLHYQLNLLPLLMLCIFCAGLLGSARYAMQAHTLQELWIGFVSGALLVGVAVHFFTG